MSSYFRNEYFYYFLILFAGGFLCFINLGGHPVYILDEAKNAEAAREMFVNNNWIVSTFNDELRTDKPVLHYWFMIIAYKIFGVSAFSARFFSAVFGVLTILSTYHFTKKFTTRKLALNTAFLLCSAIFFMQEFHLAVPDPYLIFFVSFGLFNFYDFYKSNCHSEHSGSEVKNLRDSSFLGMTKLLFFYVALGLGVLAKGPVAIALPGLIVVLFLIFKKDLKLRSILRLHPILGGFITLAICVPWFYLVHKATDGAFTEGFFYEHNLNRFGSGMEGHGGLPFVTWAFVLLGLLPYSFFIIQGFVHSWRRRKTNDFVLFSFLISAVFILFFSISGTKLPNYPMPSYPFIAVLIAVYLNGILDKSIPLKGYKISLWVLIVVTILMPVGGFIALAYAEPQLHSVRFSSLLLLILPVGSIMSMVYLYKKKLLESIISLGFATMFLTLELFSFIYPKITAQSPVSLAIEKVDTKGNAMLYKGYDPAFLFNFQRTFPFSDNKETALKFLRENPDGYIITKEKFFSSEWNDVDSEILLKQKSLFENYTTVIFRLKN